MAGNFGILVQNTRILKSKKPSGLAYQKLVEVKCNHKISNQEKWTKVFLEAPDLIWHNTYMTAIKSTKANEIFQLIKI